MNAVFFSLSLSLSPICVEARDHVDPVSGTLSLVQCSVSEPRFWIRLFEWTSEHDPHTIALWRGPQR